MKRLLIMALIIVAVVGGASAGILWWTTPAPYQYKYDTEPTFKDDVATNVQINADALNLDFVDRDGKPRKLGDYRDKKNVVLVFMRGMTKDPGGLCPTCSAQTSRLLANYAEFAKRDSELLVVFPGPKNHVAQFVEQTQTKAKVATIPFPILFDEDFQAVDRLGIRADAAKPSTFVLDKEGQVRFAYVGATSVDRPSMAALYKQLDALEPKK
jgi:peroxiredoxin